MLKYPLIWFVKGWRKVISPLYGDVCKFHPTCSAYGLRALEFHGAFKGSALTVARIVRCHPWSDGGVDYVPGTPEALQWAENESHNHSDHSEKTTTEVAK
ncbi:membrane protein insertion efficiency factor YidD [Tessaracoccus sp. OS52]|uniref:membrane protein insertion efficiency factor YidD n=1 Tax=Tessaracoccus sp. OS52 TaxID=2886691 RepID=UPI001D10809D|nr:membrane protein insertion efficiency factor YidD [Tessaracoccus sp. OS52]MCC2593816.1 membrane protein insertion efficiency factor YidD [Tessaracoccus sp. OS52]